MRPSIQRIFVPRRFGSGDVVAPDLTLKAITTEEAHATDLSGEFSITPVSYAVSGAPSGFSVNSTSGVVTWTPPANVDTQVVVTATDSGSATEDLTVRLLAKDSVLIVPVVGQSQANTHENATPAVSYPNVYQFLHNTQRIEPAVSPLGDTSTETGESMIGRWGVLYDQAHPNDIVMFVHLADGGTGLDVEWAPPSGTNYTTAVTRTNNAQAFAAVSSSDAIRIILGAHGGAATGFTTAQTRTALSDFLSTFKTDISAAANCIFVNGDIFNNTTANEEISDGFRQLDQYEDRAGGIDWITGLTGVDSLHLNQASMTIAAQRMYAVTEAVIAGGVPDAPTIAVGASGLVTPTWAYPSETVGSDTRKDYLPFRGRLPTTVTVYYTVNGGSEQSSAQSYSLGGTYQIPGLSAGDVVTGIQATVTSSGGTSARSNTATITVPAASTVASVADPGTLAVFDASGTTVSLGDFDVSGATAGDTLVFAVSVRDNAETGQVLSATINSSAVTVVASQDNASSAISVLSYDIQSADVTAGTVDCSVTFSAGAVKTRIGAGGYIYRNVDTITATVLTDVTEPIAQTLTASSGGAHMIAFTATGTNTAATGFSTDVMVFNGPIETTLQNSLYIGADTTSAPRSAGDISLTLSGMGAPTNGIGYGVVIE